MRTLTAQTYARVVRNCRELKDIVKGRQVHAELRLLAQEHGDNAVLATLLISMYANCGSVEEARLVFEESRNRNVITWNTLASAYARNGHLELSRLVVERMPQHSVVSCNLLLAACMASRRSSLVPQRFACMPERDLWSWTMLLTAYAQEGQVDEARFFFQCMPQWDSASWNVILRAFSAASPKLAKAIFDDMPDRSLTSWNTLLQAQCLSSSLLDIEAVFYRLPEHDVVSWTSMARAYAQHGRLAKCLQLFEHAPRRDVVLWTSMLVAYGLTGHPELARGVFDCMPSWDGYSYHAMVQSYARNGRLNESKDLLVSLPSTASTKMEAATVVLEAQARAGDMEGFWALFERLEHRDVICWAVLVEGLAQQRKPAECVVAFHKMPQWNTVVCSSMLRLLSTAGKLDAARWLFDQMPLRDERCCCDMAVAYLHNGRPQEATHILLAAHVRDGSAWNAVLSAYTVNGEMDKAKVVFQEIMLCRDLVSWEAMACGYARQGDAGGATDVFNRMPVHSYTAFSWLEASNDTHEYALSSPCLAVGS